MSNDIVFIVHLISTFSVVPPLILLLFVLKNTDFRLRIFLLFLLFGFITDLIGWYMYISNYSALNKIVRIFYAFVETSMLFWLIGEISINKLIKYVFRRAWIVLLILVSFCFIFPDAIIYYKTVNGLLIAFSSSFCLLKILEENETDKSILFIWILLGIFFYFFSTFFFMSLLSSYIGVRIWYGQNIVNITTNLIYFIGFLRARQPVK